ncbi:MAG: hypothetical protein ABJE95_39110 [Byssovorax sp.]
MRSRALLASAAVAVLLAPRSARAQATPVPSADLRNFHASTDPASGLYLEPASTPGTAEWNAGLWMSYAFRPITLRDPTTRAVAFDVIRHQVTGDVTASLGLFHRFALGVDLPVLVYQSGDSPTDASRRALGDALLPAQAMGDLALVVKATILKPTSGDLGGFALAAHERFTLPTGDEASFMGEGVVTSETRLLAEYGLAALSFHAALGLKLRGDSARFACESIPGAGTKSDTCPSRFGHELPFGLGVSFRPQVLGIDPKGHWTWYLESHGHLPVSPVSPFQSAAASSFQLGVGARYALRDVSILAGLETGPTGGVGDPPVRAVLGVGWAPRLHDQDGDGIEDDVDQCRELPEDKDGFQDEDGCPDGDNDDDGVPDKADKCPNVKEDEDGFQDEDGCPDPDNDADGVLDAQDACPNEAGSASPDPKKNGCPVKDPDGDGIQGAQDQCPNEPEDKDGFQDEDGCPDPDNDADGILDAADACPNVKGIGSADPKLNGCPDPDRDKDTFLDAADKCPDQAETWNGFQDEDGCPDEAPKGKAKPEITVKDATAKKPASMALNEAIKLTAQNEVDPVSLPALRALAAQLLLHPEWSLSVGARPSPKDADPAAATARAQAVVKAIRGFARREKAAEVAAWDAVKGAPRAAELGLGVVLVTLEAKVAEAKPADAKPAAPKPIEPKPKPKK